MKKYILSSFVLSFIAIVMSPGLAYAAKPAPSSPSSTPLGIDVSWPQCGKQLPKTQAFGIVGVNGGLANTTNTCLKDQLTWAALSLGGTNQEKTQLYVNTANPGGLNTASWPLSNVDVANETPVNPYGNCDGSDSLGCAWLYGRNRAIEDIRDRFVPAANAAGVNANASAYIWWLDVETENTWKLSGSTFDGQSNVAVLEGMTDYFTSQSARVGLYSTAAQWGQIAGKQVGASSSLNGLRNWRPGGANLNTAKQACTAAPLTANGSVVLTQYVSKNLDYNYSCIN